MGTVSPGSLQLCFTHETALRPDAVESLFE
jgi:hypothetical protein